MNHRQSLGREGEDQVLSLLLAKGWTLLHRNWRRPGLELDLILQKKAELLVVEVKTRRSTGHLWDASQILSWQKQKFLARGIQVFLSSLTGAEILTIRTYLAIVVKRTHRFEVNWYSLEL